MKKLIKMIRTIWHAWVEARTAYAKQYVMRQGHVE